MKIEIEINIERCKILIKSFLKRKVYSRLHFLYNESQDWITKICLFAFQIFYGNEKYGSKDWPKRVVFSKDNYKKIVNVHTNFK